MDGVALVAAELDANGEGWRELGLLGLAFLLSTLIGLERELRQKSAGLRTHTLVGAGSALIMLVSKHGFYDVIEPGLVTHDPSRVAAQIVSGIGFIGGGLIFVRRDAVRGLTTAAVVWVTAAVGMASGAGLPILAVAMTGGHFLVVYGYTALARRLPGSRLVPTFLRITYEGGYPVVRQAVIVCTGHGWVVTDIGLEANDDGRTAGQELTTLTLQIQRGDHLDRLAAELHGIPGARPDGRGSSARSTIWQRAERGNFPFGRLTDGMGCTWARCDSPDGRC